MPFNGSGLFSQIYSWVAQRNSGFDIDSTKMDSQDSSIATGLSTCICRDGQSTIIANIPFGNNKITNLGAPTTSGDAATFDYVNSQIATVVVPIYPGYLSGVALSWSSNTVYFVAAGLVTSDDGTTLMTVPGTFGKSLSTWTAGSGGAGSMESGTTVANNTWYHIYVIKRTDTGNVDILASLSATAPTLPTNYTKQRRIGSIKTAAASTSILAFFQLGNQFMWTLPIQDQVTTIGTAVGQRTLASVPLGVSVVALFSAVASNASAWVATIFSPLATGITAANTPGGNYQMRALAGAAYTMQLSIITNTSQQISAVADNASTSLTIVTNGWIDTRGQG